MPWIDSCPEGAVVEVWVVPGASRTEIRGLHDGALRVRLAVPAEGGRANRELAKLLKSETGAHDVTLLSGTASRRKTLLLHDIDVAEGQRLLADDVP
jgi:uncharacterized protein (TIGR00251 family)